MKATEDRRTISFKVDQDDYDRLKTEAAASGLSFSKWAREQLGAKAELNAARRKKHNSWPARLARLPWVILKAILYRLSCWCCAVVGLAVGAIAGTAYALLAWAWFLFLVFSVIAIIGGV